jgi:atypical dual specificity phosphatase
MMGLLNKPYHIVQGIFLADADLAPSLKAIQAENIRAILHLETERNYPPSLKDLPHISLDTQAETLSPEQLHYATRYLHQHLEAGKRVMICSQRSTGHAAVIATSYLHEYLGLEFANAYTLVATNAYLVRLPNAWLRDVAQIYQLSYTRMDLTNPNFAPFLISSVADSLSPIYKGVYIGGIRALERATKTQEQGIRAVLRVDNAERAALQWNEDYILKDMPLIDGNAIEGHYLASGAAFLQEQILQGHKTLVHCQMGVSRSVTMVLAHLIEYEGLSLPQAYWQVVKNRAIAQPHPALFASLVRHYKLPYTPEQTLSLHFRDHLLLELPYAEA